MFANRGAHRGHVRCRLYQKTAWETAFTGLWCLLRPTGASVGDVQLVNLTDDCINGRG